MGKRRAPRVKKRLACSLHHAGKRYAGMVLDLSSRGVFVQTSASPDPGEPVSLELALRGQAEPLRLEGRPARRRVVPARLRSVAQGGVGVELSSAPEAWFAFVAELVGSRAQPGAAAPRRRPTALERRARELALGRALGRRPAAPPPEPEPDPEPTAGRSSRYRVRMKLGPRKREIVVTAVSEAEARRAALAEAGAGWRVLRCEPA
jgi:Tfp pilus assembly protein PilZ